MHNFIGRSTILSTCTILLLACGGVPPRNAAPPMLVSWSRVDGVQLNQNGGITMGTERSNYRCGNSPGFTVWAPPDVIRVRFTTDAITNIEVKLDGNVLSVPATLQEQARLDTQSASYYLREGTWDAAAQKEVWDVFVVAGVYQGHTIEIFDVPLNGQRSGPLTLGTVPACMVNHQTGEGCNRGEPDCTSGTGMEGRP